MARSFCTIVLFLLSLTAMGQYIPNNSQAFQFASLYNPAFTGVENFGDLKLSYRYQWSGFGKDAPKFINLSYNTRLKQPLDLSYNALRTSNSKLGKPENLPRAKRVIHGFGVSVFSSQISILNVMGGGVNYTINYPLSSSVRFSGGVGAIIESTKLSIGEITVRDPDPYYDRLLQSATSQTNLNVRAGALVYSNRFYFGVSYLPIVNSVIQSAEVALEEPFYRGSVQAGYSFAINPDLVLKPSVLGLLHMNNEFSIDYGVKGYIQEKIWFGLTYRDIQSGIGIVGFNINETFTASYSYEMSLGDFKQFSDGSHELVLAIRVKNFRRQSQYTW